MHASSWWTPPPCGLATTRRWTSGGQMCKTLPRQRRRPCGSSTWRGSAAPHPSSFPPPPFFLLLAFFLGCTLLLTSVHPQSEVSFFPFLLFSSSYSTFSTLELLLLLSGQCPNPGPVAYPCPVCHRHYSGRGAYLCSLCKGWVHFKCSGLPRQADWHSNWGCPACSPPPPPPSPTTPSSPSSSDPSPPSSPSPPPSPAPPLVL